VENNTYHSTESPTAYNSNTSLPTLEDEKADYNLLVVYAGFVACQDVGSLRNPEPTTRRGGVPYLFKIGIVVNDTRRQDATQIGHDGDTEFSNGLYCHRQCSWVELRTLTHQG
jgi:hypothetical protein